MKKISLLICIVTFLSCSPKKISISPTAVLITDVNIVDVSNGDILKNRQVVIDSGKIKKILESVGNVGEYPNIIEAKGKYLIPGLAEMHAHIPQPPTSDTRIEETLFLYLSNGITTIRGMLGHPTHLVLREKALNGEVLSPRIFTSSPSFNGNSVTTKEEAVQMVTAYKDEGYDFLKIHPGIELEVFDQMVETANELNIPFAGHVPVMVGIRHALESKYATIDHVDGYLEGLVPQSEAVDPTANGFFGYSFTTLADTSKIDELVALSKKNQVWVVPTQSLFERWFAPVSSDELLKQPEMKYMPVSTLENWKRRKDESTKPETGFNEEQWSKFTAIRRELIRKLQENGHGMLLGSDAPQLFNVPGFSIHHEVEGMKEAGLTPLEILQSGTINPAIFFGMEDTFGSIREGLDADLVLLGSNPLLDISALKDINGVMVRGKWLSQDSIAEQLGQIASNAKNN
ncbi:amidohydrolase family protein [Arenibacter sp. M-2]|uniref:amidohydrolase family protein n=1 Tax=Arenibacter sp. M-2 TaxID=3053612 RepID=UPI0025701C43|nr:amidohydrolase family protein [Arenibacter sp. M-2]MDL5511787.1 amidohydrolase family protein [Arenibacter sp. M-2]|tara:strand:- start:19853 stop:21229 length:1377 start_codon:yes stop_codon:yes gene_type:complete